MGKIIVSSSALKSNTMLAKLNQIVLCNVYKILFVFSGLHGYFVRVAVLLLMQHAGETTISIAKLPSSV